MKRKAVRVVSGSPSPLVGAGRHAEAGERLTTVGVARRQSTTGGVTCWYKDLGEGRVDGNMVSAADVRIRYDEIAPEIRRAGEAGVVIDLRFGLSRTSLLKSLGVSLSFFAAPKRIGLKSNSRLSGVMIKSFSITSPDVSAYLRHG